MTANESTILDQEINKFAQHANQWWNTNGPLRTLHDINFARVQFIEQQISLSGLSVLDLGCGGGILSEALANLGAKVTGIDAECAAIEAAKSHAKKSQLSIDYQCTAVEEYKEGGFDVITCMELLEHVQNPELVLAHCKRLLKPQGLLFVSTLSRTFKSYVTAILAAEYVLKLLPKQTHDYDKFIRPSELSALARTFDFSLREMSGMTYNPLTRQAILCKNVSVNYLMSFALT